MDAGPFSTLPSALAEIAAALQDAGAVDAVCHALHSRDLNLASSPVRHSAIAAGNGVVETKLRDLQDLWRRFPDLSSTALALALQSAAAAQNAERQRAARTEVVWTGPCAETSYLRATRQVVLDLVRVAHTDLLVVGYWIASNSDPSGIIPKIIKELSVAKRRGVLVKVVLDQTALPNGGKNRDQFLSLWPHGLEPPTLLTWRGTTNDAHLKLHAKVIVADRKDALVTSANLTMHGMELNMEMGFRVTGEPATSIATHFDLLMDKGILQSFGDDI